MVTDRCSTLGLLYVLGNDYEKYDDQIGFPIYQIVSNQTASAKKKKKLNPREKSK